MTYRVSSAWFRSSSANKPKAQAGPGREEPCSVGRPRTFLRRMWEIPQSIPILRGTMAPTHCYPQTGGVISMTYDEEGPETYTSARDVVVGWIIVAILLSALALLSTAA